jgi:hypothetical protein
MAAANPATELMRLVNGYRVSQAIHVVATLGIADLLKEGARSSDDLYRVYFENRSFSSTGSSVSFTQSQSATA